jgi:signal transduction histidine kinase
MTSAGWWARRSLRLRLTVAATTLFVLGSAGAAALLAVYLRHSLLGAIDDGVRQRARDVAAVAAGGTVPSRLPVTDGESIVQLVDAAGHTLARGSASAAAGVDLAGTGVRAGTVSERRLWTGDPEPTRYRVAAVAVGAEPGTVAYAAAPADDVQDTVSMLLAALAIGGPVAAALVAVGTWALVGRALSPVERLRQQAGALSVDPAPGGAPAPRLDVPPAADELARLAGTFNDLLDRVEAGLRRERRLVADTAHELRSPVAAALARAELAVRYQPAAVQVRALLGDVRRLARLVEDLLVLTRLHGPPAGRPDRAVDLDDLVFAEAAATRPRPGIRIDLSAVSAAQVSGDGAMLERVVRNLLDNAVRHARSAVSVSLAARDGVAELTVADDGPGVQPPDREAVFERFARLDEARARDAGGVGLGLAIVRDVVSAHAGTVAIEDAEPGARFVVRLPR